MKTCQRVLRKKIITEDIVIYNGDCREVLKQIDYAGFVFVTDPPYGINLGKTNKKKDKINKGWKPKSYNEYNDSLENFKELVPHTINKLLERCTKGIVFIDGTRIHYFPEPSDVSLILRPYSWGFSPLGWKTLDFFLFYGTVPNAFKDGKNNIAKHLTCTHDSTLKSKHPAAKCPKCLEIIIRKITNEDDLVIDPFMGGGATGIASVHANRKYIGIELDPKYYKVSEENIRIALKKPNLINKVQKLRKPNLLTYIQKDAKNA
jgi:DNA modification methylase